MKAEERLDVKKEVRKGQRLLFGLFFAGLGIFILKTAVEIEQADAGLLGLFVLLGCFSIVAGGWFIILAQTKGKISLFNQISFFKRRREWHGCSNRR